MARDRIGTRIDRSVPPKRKSKRPIRRDHREPIVPSEQEFFDVFQRSDILAPMDEQQFIPGDVLPDVRDRLLEPPPLPVDLTRQFEEFDYGIPDLTYLFSPEQPFVPLEEAEEQLEFDIYGENIPEHLEAAFQNPALFEYYQGLPELDPDPYSVLEPGAAEEGVTAVAPWLGEDEYAPGAEIPGELPSSHYEDILRAAGIDVDAILALNFDPDQAWLRYQEAMDEAKKAAYYQKLIEEYYPPLDWDSGYSWWDSSPTRWGGGRGGGGGSSYKPTKDWWLRLARWNIS